jgi:CubicO group peptidase (beta-lactamase class C family)
MKKAYSLLISFILATSILVSNVYAKPLELNTYSKAQKHVTLKDKNCESSIIRTQINDYLDSMTNNRNFHGSVLVEKKGKVILSKGYGMADYENNIKNTNKTTFPIGSITKQFIALSIMQLVEDNKISVNDKLSKFISDYPNGDQVTIKQLLTHTSRIKSYFQGNTDLDTKISSMPPESITPENLIKIIGQEGLSSTPENTFVYNNSGYLILGHIVEIISGLELKDYLNTHIFRPLKMENTSPAYINGNKMYNSKGYLGYLDNILDEKNDEFLLNAAFGAGYISSNVIDMNKWSNALDDYKLVSKKTMDEIFTPTEYTKIVAKIGSAVYGYGYGWFVSTDGKKVMHGGNCVAFSSLISKYLDQDINITILTNKTGSGIDIYSIDENLYKICCGEKVELPKAKVEIKLSNEQLNKYAGKYYNENLKFSFDVSIANGYLTVTTTPVVLEPFALVPESEENFYSKSVTYEIKFSKDLNGNITSLNFNNMYEFVKQ